MPGQLNASHMGLIRGENPKQTQTQTQTQLTSLLGIKALYTNDGFEIT